MPRPRPRRRRRRLRRIRRLFTLAAVVGAAFAWRERQLRENAPPPLDTD